MTLAILAFIGGVLTVFGPCVLPVLPFVFVHADRPFRANGLPMLLAMAVTFALVASLAAVAGGWAVHANQYGRAVALALFALFGLGLLLPRLAQTIAAPVVALGNRLTDQGLRGASPVLMGVGTGLLWAPCAGPILGLVLTRAALDGPGVTTSLLLLSYAAGACTALAAALLFGGRLVARLRSSQGAGSVLRRIGGAAVLASVVAIALGIDTGVLARVAQENTMGLETALVQKVQTPTAAPKGPLPALAGATGWINSQPLTAQSLAGKVVLVDFWTYSCINCLRTLPYVRAWAEKYRDAGLVVVGVHSPEFAFEKSPANVRRAVMDLEIDFAVAQDNDFAIWRAFDNRAWPAFYFIDATGQVRHRQFGEGQYEAAERLLQKLLAESGQATAQGSSVAPSGLGTQAATGAARVLSGETYLGYARAEGFSGRLEKDRRNSYTAPEALRREEWALNGVWTAEQERLVLNTPNGRLLRRFHARDLHLVLGSEGGAPVRFRVKIDGKPPGSDHGFDTDAQGLGTISAHRLYQLVRHEAGSKESVFEIEFLDEGALAYAFTFG
ncbi:cytochrome c biogenesis protein DipZ [Acidovorax sp.]|uniref:cytochrome c biogenesis protein DipZ n=1 Tax=Acidovorax sp. TaxID=1872122 RepID=UPI002ACD908A|nr:redoxin family protein [Acidovorax sp.]MDZ7862870.1 cytochrome c biogenesis protein CcdA [Acidovorax sp.]